MANSKTNDYTIRIDTAFTDNSFPDEYTITTIMWVSSDETNRDIAADDDMELTDGSGVIQYQKRAEYAGDDFGAFLTIPRKITGLKVPKLDGGILRIHLLQR